MNRYIILAMAAAALLITATEAHGSDDTYRREADSFLSDMPQNSRKTRPVQYAWPFPVTLSRLMA